VPNPRALFVRGRAYAQLLDFERAETDLWACLDADPSQADPLAQIGYLQACIGQDETAIRMLKAALKADPRGQAEARLWLFHLLSDAGETDAAAAELAALRADAADALPWPRLVAELLAGDASVDELLAELPDAGPADEAKARTCALHAHD